MSLYWSPTRSSQSIDQVANNTKDCKQGLDHIVQRQNRSWAHLNPSLHSYSKYDIKLKQEVCKQMLGKWMVKENLNCLSFCLPKTFAIIDNYQTAKKPPQNSAARNASDVAVFPAIN